MTETLNLVTLPLWGSRLIEASAGTGKTWTIAALYLRLVLGHGGENAFARPLLPCEILVMTFTRAATRELSDRIRSRLLTAAQSFRGESQPDPADALLIALLADHPSGAARSAAAWRLAMAAQSMDDAAICTIDAWCQRMLREHAFDSGAAFDEALNADERAMQLEAAQDFWRRQLYPLAGGALDVALGVWKNVAALADDAHELLALPLPLPLPEDAVPASLGALIERLSAQRGAALAALKAGWSQRAHGMQAWLDAQMASKACPFNKVKLHARHYTPWLAALAAWADDPAADLLDMSTAAVSRLTPAGMEDALNGKHPVDLPDHFAAFECLLRARDELPAITSELRAFATASIAHRLAELKRQAGTFGFADLLTRLDEALNPALNPGNAGRLRARMLAQHPVALVDEFQDTSPLQSRIFDRLYCIADNERASGLLLIGDPKQSIYGFRGADIHSYLTARRATADRHYVLGTNHRSTQALVSAVNHLFGQAEARAGEGAFMFRAAGTVQAASPAASQTSSDAANPLPFIPVAARGRAETFVTSARIEPALTLALDAELSHANTSRRQFAARCAERIVSLLNDPHAGFDDPSQGFTRLRPADIAVLVRTGREAAAVRRELRRRAVASVYLSDQVSVFASAEARDLLRWLRAVAAPLDVRLARAALATRTLGLSIAELAVLAADDEAFDARAAQLRQLHTIWRSQGVLTMLRQTLHRFDLPARWLAAPIARSHADEARTAGDDGGDGDGERRLTNVLHLAELLQAASAQLDGEQALIRWMAGQITGDAAGADEQIVRLESDADLVKVVTVHKAKGLEYPLVFLPFACGFRAIVKARTRFVSLADEAGARSLYLQPSAAQIAAADRERQREDLRLLYVALTRAHHALWVGVAALKVGRSTDCMFHRCALGYLLGGARPTPADALAAQLEMAVEGCPDIALIPATAPSARTALTARGVPVALREPSVYAANFERRWGIGSFSALVRDLPVTRLWSTSTAAARDDELASADEVAAPAGPGLIGLDAGAAAPPWHRFPRGAVPGNFLHDQLEWLAATGFDLATSIERREHLLRRCERQGWGARAADVVAWLAQLVATPLPPVGAALADLRSPLPEMEFWFPSAGVAAAEIDALCRTHLLAGRDRPALPERELRGMLMGFADLVFEHGGRYWVLDYKSNHLGASDADYDADALEAAMAQHRYDVQAALYLLALHRLLRNRLGESYDPARQLGGAVFFFLRGFRGPAGGAYHLIPPPVLLTDLSALLSASGAEA